MRRRAPVFVAVAVALLLGTYVAYTQRVVTALRREAAQSGRMYARVYRGLTDINEEGGGAAALLDLARQIRESHVPLVITDSLGVPTDTANLPFSESLTSSHLKAYVGELDRRNLPVTDVGTGVVVHYGDSPLVFGLRLIPLLQAGALGMLILAGAYVLRVRANAEREHVWAGMARESAHQLGTPLSSLTGWIELLGERDGDPLTATAITHMQADLERLVRVAHRFERIGRPARKEFVDLADIASRVVTYYRARVPTLAHTIAIGLDRPDEPLTVKGDAVLLEWVIESLVKNAVDALAGRGGFIKVAVERLADGGTRLRVADDGPGIPRELRVRVFEPGFSTKEHGWGIGLSLARRIVQDNHRGRLQLTPSDQGATFDVILQ